MRQINVAVRNRVAEYIYGERYVCGNNDYAIAFDFDTEWGAYDTKTARFVTGRRYLDVVFNGDVCPVPVLNNVTMFKVGVFAGDIRTTTPAQVPALKSILDNGCAPLPPPTDVYAQIMQQLNALASRVDEGQAVATTSADWNENDPEAAGYIKNRPFYTETLLEPLTRIEWDDETEILETAGPFRKISDLVLSLEQLVGAVFTDGSVEYTLAAPGSEQESNNFVLNEDIYGAYHMMDCGPYFASGPGCGPAGVWEGSIPSAGIWVLPGKGHCILDFSAVEQKAVSEVEVVHKLDDKYLNLSLTELGNKLADLESKMSDLDSKMGNVTLTYTWDGNTEGLEHCQRNARQASSNFLDDWYKISGDIIPDFMLSDGQGSRGRISVGGASTPQANCRPYVYDYSVYDYSVSYILGAAFAERPLVVFANGKVGDLPYFPSAGIWVCDPSKMKDAVNYALQSSDTYVDFPMRIEIDCGMVEAAQLAESAISTATEAKSATNTLNDRLTTLEEKIAELTAADTESASEG